MVDVQRDTPGHWHFSLGPVEKTVITASAALLVFLASSAYISIVNRQEAQSVALEQIKVQNAVANAVLIQVSAQLADLPALRLKVAENSVVIRQAQKDIDEIRGTRGGR